MHHRKTYLYFNFQQNRVSIARSVKTVHTNLLTKNASYINLQLPIVILKKSILLDMHHRKTYMYVNIQQNRVSRSKPCTQIYLPKNGNCINLQLAIRV